MSASPSGGRSERFGLWGPRWFLDLIRVLEPKVLHDLKPLRSLEDEAITSRCEDAAIPASVAPFGAPAATLRAPCGVAYGVGGIGSIPA